MALPSSGPISLSQVNVELGVSATATRSLNDSTTRTLFGVPSGTISMSQGYGKSNNFVFNATLATNTQNYNLKSAAIAAGWNQTAPLVATVTINSGVVVGSSSTGSFAFDTGVTFPSGSTLTVTNNGSIVGCGGSGGYRPTNAGAGVAGGPAFRAQAAVTVYNNGTVGGGGGGGGAGGGGAGWRYFGGGGGGGGAGNSVGSGGAGTYGTSASGATGSNGTTTSGGGGGFGGNYRASCNKGGNGATGGSLGSAGGKGTNAVRDDCSVSEVGGSGGAAGACTSGNANITWAVTGTRYGALN